jgi:hypothetical protein
MAGQDHDSRTAPPDATPDAAGAARLREHIDRGGSGDKVAFSDPATAPLGTDAEAGGAPPTRAEVALAAEAEKGRAPEAQAKPGPAERQGASAGAGLWLVAGIALVLVALAAVLLAL